MSQLETNIIDLQTILATVNALPDAGSGMLIYAPYYYGNDQYESVVCTGCQIMHTMVNDIDMFTYGICVSLPTSGTASIDF